MLLHSYDQLACIPRRIISLVPSQTELLADLGLEDSVAGITKFCVHPASWIKTKVIIGGTKNINVQKIKSCSPDLIIANKEENVKEQVEALAKDYPVWVTDVTNLDSALKMTADIGMLTDTYAKANEIIERIRLRFKKLPFVNPAIKTCYLIWRLPYMTIGSDTFIHDMLAKCGFQNLYAAAKRYPEININELSNKNCQLLILSSEPYPFRQKHLDELKQLLPGIKIIIADGEMFSWYGSRLLHAPGYFKTMIDRLSTHFRAL